MKKFSPIRYYGSCFRGLLWRLGRKLYCYARNDLPQRPENNGEYQLLQIFLKTSKERVTLVDIGANVGEWTSKVLSLAKPLGKDAAIHIFEPSNDSFLYWQKFFQFSRPALAATEGKNLAYLFVAYPLLTSATFVESWITPTYIGGIATIVLYYFAIKITISIIARGHQSA
jgi:hypothetical protein